MVVLLLFHVLIRIKKSCLAKLYFDISRPGLGVLTLLIIQVLFGLLF